MSYAYYPQKLPKELKGLQLERLSGQELIDVCNDPNSLFYSKTCTDPMFWKDKILNDFPIDNEKWKTPKTKTIRDPKTKKIIGKEEVIGTKYDIFNSISNYDPFWIYKVLYYYFSQLENPEDKRTNNIGNLLHTIYGDADLVNNSGLLNELMKNPNVVPWIITSANVDVLGYIYENYPTYRKTILINILFIDPELVEEFQNKYHPDETFTFSELGSIIAPLDEPIMTGNTDEFLDDVISMYTKSKKVEQESKSSYDIYVVEKNSEEEL